MSYKIPGITKPTSKSCASSTQVMLGLKKPVKPRKERAKETKPRSREEAEFRKEAISYLRHRGFYVKRIENSICNALGNDIPDLLFFTNKKMYFCELKSKNGKLGFGQMVFKEKCISTGVAFIMPRNIQELHSLIYIHESMNKII